jgi:hypothetical protein
LEIYQVLRLAITINHPVPFPSALSPSGGHPEGILSILKLLEALPASVLVLVFN